MTVESQPPGLSDSIHKMLKDIKAAVTKLELDMVELKGQREVSTHECTQCPSIDMIRDEIREALGLDGK